jgi:hypothetical protein
MKQFGIALLLMASLFTQNAFAGSPWVRFFQDLKAPTQAMIEHYTWTNPVLGTASYVQSGAVLATSAATTISTFTQQPDVARNILLTPTGTTASIGAGTAVVTGTNVLGQIISENFTITSSQSTATTGAKAFKTITSVAFPATSGSGATLSIGTGTKLGINRCAADAGKYIFSEFGGVYDATRGTFAISQTAAESNTFIDNSAYDGAHNVELFYVQNYQCH